ncbi:MAG TPA: AbrB/MazE/SpoVT family DNA-binding domain-containing protein [Candidatus Paceibacterota bacterium]
MTYSTTITKKGQITIPKKLRDALRVRAGERLTVELEKSKEAIRIKPAMSLRELAGSFRVKKPIDPVKIREYMEKHYQRA